MVTLSNLSIGISEFKKNPARILREARGRPIAVLNRGKLAFYVLGPRLFEAMVEDIQDIQLAELATKRVATEQHAVRVKLEDL